MCDNSPQEMCACDRTLVSSFFENKCLRCVEYLIDKDIERAYIYIPCAITTDDENIIKLFLEKNIIKKDSVNSCLYTIIRRKKNIKLVDLFRNFPNFDTIVLGEAIRENELGLVIEMLEKGIRIKDDSIRTDNLEILKLLFKYEILDLNYICPATKKTLLHEYAKKENYEICEYLINEGIKVGIKDCYGYYEANYAFSPKIKNLIIQAMFKKNTSIKIN